jgi:hypothetical protein
MFCPKCGHPNPADADTCVKCQQDTRYFRERVFIGRQFIFVQAEAEHPVALKVDDVLQTYHTATILSRHQHAVGFGDEPAKGSIRDIWLDPTARQRLQPAWPLPDQPRLPYPSLKLLTVVSDRKIYRPGTDAALFIVAPDAAESEAALEVRLAGQKVYEAKVALNRDGLALHRYPDLKEGEYTAVVTLPDNAQAECTFSVAEFTLSPLIATLEKHEYTDQRLTFTLRLLVLSVPYSGPVEFGLQCQVCGERVVATQKINARDGVAQGEFDLARHGGPFHVQVTTPDGNTALVSFPGTGAVEREHIPINPLGQTAEMGLLPWENAEPVRGFYVGPGEVNLTPLMLESVHAAVGRLQAAADMSLAQIVTFNPRAGTSQVARSGDRPQRCGANLQRGEAMEFGIDAPYTLFTVGAFTRDQPFEGWGIVIKPVAFEATLTAPETARPGQEIAIHIRGEWRKEGTEVSEGPKGTFGSSDPFGPSVPSVPSVPFFCWLLVYDARLEHESPVPKLAKRIYESARNATGNLAVGPAPNARDQEWAPPEDFVRGLVGDERGMPRVLRFAVAAKGLPMVAEAMPAAIDIELEAPAMVVSPARMEFPELAYLELFYMEGEASRTVKLGDQIGTWRVRAYLFQGADYRELTADVQADKPLYAELDLPAIASAGDDISAAVNYHTRRPADLVIATAYGETRARVEGSGTQRFAIRGPGRVEVHLESQEGADWTVRDVAWPGVQKVTASRLMILDRGQTVQSERVVVYPSMGQVLKDTITALIGYPFG